MNKALIIQTCRIDVADAPAETRTSSPLGGQFERVSNRAVKGAASETQGRPSSIRRRHKMQALLEELSTRDMDTASVAIFLNCSDSSARKYLNDLLGASVVRLRRSVPLADCHVGSIYRLNDDPCAARNFLLDLHESHRGDAVFKEGREQTSKARAHGNRHFHIMADDHCTDVRATLVRVRRDPLVAALFGEPIPLDIRPIASRDSPQDHSCGYHRCDQQGDVTVESR